MSASLKKDTAKVLAEQLVAGTKKHFSNAGSLMFGGGTFTPAQVEASLQAIVDLRTAVDKAKADTKAKVEAEKAQTPSLRSQMAAFVTFVRATFGNAPDILADFGLKPKKARTPPTTETKAAALAKTKATRTARHTMGSKAKKKVKGTVMTIVTAPSSTPATPVAVTPSPAASAPATPAASSGTAPRIP
jgi:hypothetical protein